MGFRLGRSVAAVLAMASFASLASGSVRAESWDRIGRYASLIRRAGTDTMVAKDCPPSLLGAFHSQRNALLLCANNLENDPKQIWVVLAHESAHVMQHCRGGALLADHQVDDALEAIEARSRATFQELRLYHQSQQREEIEARLVQSLPPREVEALFRRFCADRLPRASVSAPPAISPDTP